MAAISFIKMLKYLFYKNAYALDTQNLLLFNSVYEIYAVNFLVEYELKNSVLNLH